MISFIKEHLFAGIVVILFAGCIWLGITRGVKNTGIKAGWVVGKQYTAERTYSTSSMVGKVVVTQLHHEPATWLLVVDSGGVVERVNVCREQYDTTKEGTFYTIKR